MEAPPSTLITQSEPAAAMVDTEGGQWTLTDGAPAFPETTCKFLACEIANALGDPDMAMPLLKTMAAGGAIVVSDLREMYAADLLEALAQNGLKPSIKNTLRRFVFGPNSTRDFPLIDRSDSVLSIDSSCHSEKSTMPKFSTDVSITALFPKMAGYSDVFFPTELNVMISEMLSHSASEAGQTKSLSFLFMFHVVTFKNTYLNTLLKQRYAYLMWILRNVISIEVWKKSVNDGFSNRRQGRIATPYHFHSREVVDNKGFEELQAKFGTKQFFADEEGYKFYPDCVTDFSSSNLVSHLCSMKTSSSSCFGRTSSSSSEYGKPSSSGTSSPVPITSQPVSTCASEMEAGSIKRPKAATPVQPHSSTPHVAKFSASNLGKVKATTFFSPRSAVTQPLEPVEYNKVNRPQDADPFAGSGWQDHPSIRGTDEAKMRANAEAAQRKLDDFLKAKAAAAAKAVPAVEVEGEGEAEAEEAEKADEATEADDVCAYEPLCVTQDAHCEEAMGVDPTDDEEEIDEEEEQKKLANLASMHEAQNGSSVLDQAEGLLKKAAASGKRKATAALTDAERAAKEAKAAETRRKKDIKISRKSMLKTQEWQLGEDFYKVDFVPYNAGRIVKDAVIIHIFDADTETQFFSIGTITKKNKGNAWVNYPVDRTEFKHNLAKKDYLNLWAYGELKQTGLERAREISCSQPAA